MNIDQKKLDKILKYLTYILPLIIIYVLSLIYYRWDMFDNVPYILGVFSPFFIALLIAWLFDPFVTYLAKKGIKRGYGTTIVFLGMFLTIYIGIYIFIPVVIDQLAKFINYLPELGSTLETYIKDLIDNLIASGIDYDFNTLYTEIVNQIQSSQGIIIETISGISNVVVSFVLNLSSSIFRLILILTMAFYLLVDFNKFKTGCTRLIPRKYRDTSLTIINEINGAVSGYISSFLIISLIVFLLAALAFSVMGINASLLLALFIGITNVIPYLGPFIGGVPAVLMALTQSFPLAIAVVIVIVIIQQFDALVLKPLLMGKSTNLHPVAIILGIFVFGQFFGILGIIFATPIVASLRIILIHLNKKYHFFTE